MPRPRTKSRLGEAIHQARRGAGLTQGQLGAAVGIAQPRVSDWEGEAHLEVEEALDLLGRIDLACGKTRGHILRLAEFIDSDAAVVDVPGAIASDPTLDGPARELLLLAYDYCRRTAHPAPTGYDAFRAEVTAEDRAAEERAFRAGLSPRPPRRPDEGHQRPA